MSKSSSQDVHADAPDGAIDAFLKKFDIADSFGDFATVGTDPSHPGSMYFGSGNSDQNYHLQENKSLGIELGLKEHFRTGDDILHDNSVTGHDVADFNAPAGTQITDPAHNVSSDNANRAAWNFDFAVATGLDGQNTSLSDFTFKLEITQNGTNTHTFVLNPSTHVWIDQANPTAGFGGDDFNHPATAAVQSHVAENSVNLAFLSNVFGPLSTSAAAGATYDIHLEAFKGNQLVGLVQDHVILTQHDVLMS